MPRPAPVTIATRSVMRKRSSIIEVSSWMGKHIAMPWQAQTLVLAAGSLAAALALGWGEHRGPRALVYAAKPLATLLILALAWLAPPGADPLVGALDRRRAGLLARGRRAADAAVRPFCRRARQLPASGTSATSRPSRSEAGFQLAPLALVPLLVAVGSCTAGSLPGSAACASR